MKFIVQLIALFVISMPALAAAPQRQIPIQVEADQMVSTQKNNSVFFSGRVVAKQGLLTIDADELTIYYATRTGGRDVNSKGTKEIRRMSAQGRVKIIQKGWVASGDTAEYFEAARKVVIVGHVRVWRDNNLVTGDRFVLFLDEGKSIVEHDRGKGGRVKAFFYPAKNK
ncbi:MAG: lipopolysaccharide transport periplasmic protein LptA [Deltaproteobacteria bacterium]|nr:lipopolysaccharide transport periplasmic protein LptA [Deltaproteobacteria bacterium]